MKADLSPSTSVSNKFIYTIRNQNTGADVIENIAVSEVELFTNTEQASYLCCKTLTILNDSHTFDFEITDNNEGITSRPHLLAIYLFISYNTDDNPYSIEKIMVTSSSPTIRI